MALKALSPILSVGLLRPGSSMSGASGINATGNEAGGTIPKGFKMASVPRFNPETTNLFQSLLGGLRGNEGLASGLGMTSRLAGGDFSALEPQEDYARSQFDQSIGKLGSRFGGAGMGPYGRLGSSAFQTAAAGEASNLAERLAANRMGLQRQALQDLLSLSQTLFQNQPTENLLVQKKPSFLQNLSGGVGQGLGQAAAMLPFLL